ncbi:MAG: hypothetical protein POELPBGB_00528 [Bacteroidia bacterium]|nr:hypothetical protein [Bacteroidia bacterium]
MRSATVFLFSMIFIASNNIAYAQKSKKEDKKAGEQNEAPPRDSVTGDFKYQEVVQLDTSITKEEIFNKAKNFLLKRYISTSELLQLADIDKGEIIIKVSDLYPEIGRAWIQDNKVEYTVTIEVKEGKYRYTFDDFIHRYLIGKYTTLEVRPLEKTFNVYEKQMWKATHETVSKTIIELKEAIERKSKPDDDW